MVQCSIVSCKLNTDSGCHAKIIKESKITFLKIPKQADKKAKWHFLLTDHCINLDKKKIAYICSRHFTPDSFHFPGNGKQRRLMPNAVPTIFNFDNHDASVPIQHLPAVSAPENVEAFSIEENFPTTSASELDNNASIDIQNVNSSNAGQDLTEFLKVVAALQQNIENLNSKVKNQEAEIEK